MPAQSADALVLGAGIVGISVALHLQRRGRATVLIDRRGPAEETSYGNAGLIQREGVYPYGFPHDFGALARYMVLNAAWKMDTVGNKVAKKEIAMIKVLAPNVACQVIDWAMQVHGAGGVSDDFGLAHAYAHARTLRFADGPDEVHRNAIAKWELGKYGSYGRDAQAAITRGG